MPSGTCSRRAGFADTIRLLASLIVLGCSIAGRTGENAFGKRRNRIANAISSRGALGPQRTLLDAVMAWRWSARHSLTACRASQFGRCNGAGILRGGGPNHDGRANAVDRKAV